MSRPLFDKARVERIIRANAELGVAHENITRILNYEYDIPSVTFVSTQNPTSKKVSYGTLREEGGHSVFLEL
jgi:hypothetical protein